MKITNAQVSALARDIQRKIQAKRSLREEELRKFAKLKTFLKEKEVKKILAKAEKERQEEWVIEQLEKEDNMSVYISDIENAILVASISSKDIAELILGLERDLN